MSSAPMTAETTSTFIRTINFGQQRILGSNGEKKADHSTLKEIEIAMPGENEENCLTVICGKNRTGKSHFLHHTHQALRAHNQNMREPEYDAGLGTASANVWVRPKDPTKRFADHLLLANLSTSARKFETLSLQDPAYRDVSNGRGMSSLRSSFVRDQLLHAPSFAQAINRPILEEDLKPKAFEALHRLLDPGKLYRLNVSLCPPLSTFERMCGGTLFFRVSAIKGFEPVLRYSRDEATTFGTVGSGWSQGQKVAFVLCLVLYYLRPSILLIDELENHLHPEFISGLCDLIKKYVPQSIVTTHHPHLIFSTHADRVWFFEVDPPGEQPGLIEDMPTKRPDDRAHPKRRISDLSTDFERVSAAYRLFDTIDRQLLDVGLSARSEVAFRVLDCINGGLTLKVVAAGTGERADGQTNALAEEIQQIIQRREDTDFRVLDYGAGSGRTFLELAKIKKLNLRHAHWTLYEPNAKQAGQLGAHLSEKIDEGKVIVATDLNKVNPPFDLILAVNLLHECTPRDIYRFFQDSRNILSRDGRVLIAELHPLLEPERFGIGYTSSEMIEITSACGFSSYSSVIPMRGGALTAYMLIAKPAREESEEDAVERIVTDVWSGIKRRHLTEYGDIIETRRARDAVKLASQLHAIASIDSYAQGSWRDLGD